MEKSMATIEDLNFLNDSRNCGPAPREFTVVIDEEEILLPTRWEVCGVCDGKGKHVDPSIDCGGLNLERFDNDPDFERAYFSGAYNITCNRCAGRTTVAAPDFDKMTPELLRAYKKQEREIWQDEQEYRAELLYSY
jgi:hypothetical protein